MKKLIRIEADVIRCNAMKKGPRQMISIASRLYRTDDDLMISDSQTSDCICVYPIDDTQPLLTKAKLVDPDMTRLLIRSAKLSGNRRNIWAMLDSSKIMQILSIVAIVGGVLYGFISFGGIQL